MFLPKALTADLHWLLKCFNSLGMNLTFFCVSFQLCLFFSNVIFKGRQKTLSKRRRNPFSFSYFLVLWKRGGGPLAAWLFLRDASPARAPRCRCDSSRRRLPAVGPSLISPAPGPAVWTPSQYSKDAEPRLWSSAESREAKAARRSSPSPLSPLPPPRANVLAPLRYQTFLLCSVDLFTFYPHSTHLLSVDTRCAEYKDSNLLFERGELSVWYLDTK